MSIPRFLLFAIVFTGAVILSERSAHAQLPGQYFPGRAPISPYFAYAAVNTTGLPNYYTYIRPAQQARAFFDGQQAARTREETRLVIDERKLDALENRRLGQRQITGSGVAAVPGAYQQYSHYYSNPISARRR